jgi:Ser/Thr protein kinase RdoA (MazF antagonist)
MNTDDDSAAKAIAWAKTRIAIDTRAAVPPPLAGATSSTLIRLQAEGGPVIVRIFLPDRWGDDFTGLAERETAILESLRSTGLPVPEPLGHDSSPDHEWVLMSCLQGSVWLPDIPSPDWLVQLGRMLATIHTSDNVYPRTYRTWNQTKPADPPQWWSDRSLWKQAQAIVLADEPAFIAEPLHRDYHPCNVLWQNGTLTGVVDWVNACMGPASVDLAHCRVNLTAMYSINAADQFLMAYLNQRPDFEHHPYWDLDSAVGWMPEPFVYKPWTSFGLAGLTTQGIRQRLAEFIEKCISANP